MRARDQGRTAADCLQPDLVARFRSSAREQIVCVEIDAHAGGWFYIVERRDGENVEHIGEYLEIVRPRRLVLTLSVEKYSLDFERVTVVFEPYGTGCELSLTHKTKPELVRQVCHGWIEALKKLVRRQEAVSEHGVDQFK